MRIIISLREYKRSSVAYSRAHCCHVFALAHTQELTHNSIIHQTLTACLTYTQAMQLDPLHAGHALALAHTQELTHDLPGVLLTVAAVVRGVGTAGSSNQLTLGGRLPVKVRGLTGCGQSVSAFSSEVAVSSFPSTYVHVSIVIYAHISGTSDPIRRISLPSCKTSPL